VQKRVVDPQTAAALVINQSKPLKFVHEKVDPGACRDDHLREKFLSDSRNFAVRRVHIPGSRKKQDVRASRFSLELNI